MRRWTHSWALIAWKVWEHSDCLLGKHRQESSYVWAALWNSGLEINRHPDANATSYITCESCIASIHCKGNQGLTFRTVTFYSYSATCFFETWLHPTMHDSVRCSVTAFSTASRAQGSCGRFPLWDRRLTGARERERGAWGGRTSATWHLRAEVSVTQVNRVVFLVSRYTHMLPLQTTSVVAKAAKQ